MDTIIDIEDVKDEFKSDDLPFTYDLNNDRILDVNKIERAIIAAQDKVNGYLRKVNISTVGFEIELKRELRRQMLDLTRYYFSDNLGDANGDGTVVKIRYDETISWFKDLLAGRVVLSTMISRNAGFGEAIPLIF